MFPPDIVLMGIFLYFFYDLGPQKPGNFSWNQRIKLYKM